MLPRDALKESPKRFGGKMFSQLYQVRPAGWLLQTQYAQLVDTIGAEHYLQLQPIQGCLSESFLQRLPSSACTAWNENEIDFH